MTSVPLQLTPRDAVVARDGRPFGAKQGYRMRSLDWPLPSVVAGSVRTALGKQAEKSFDDGVQQALLATGVAGAFPVADGKLYLPAPHDAVHKPKDGKGDAKLLRSRPEQAEFGGCVLPNGLWPVLLPASGDDDFKPGEMPAWWPLDEYAKWLVGDAVQLDARFLRKPAVEERMHVQIDPERGAAAESLLYMTSALRLTRLVRYGTKQDDPLGERTAEITLAARVEGDGDGWPAKAANKLDLLSPLGGERRLVRLQHAPHTAELWSCPKLVREKLPGAARVRLTLATPAIFRNGWRPGWLNARDAADGPLVGSPPGSSVKLELVAATFARWKAVSGWSYRPIGPQNKPGPKPLRRMVPAGGTYYFEVVEQGAAADLAKLWLHSVCDDEQERRDGFGLAAWGVW